MLMITKITLIFFKIVQDYKILLKDKSCRFPNIAKYLLGWTGCYCSRLFDLSLKKDSLSFLV